jgi:mannose-1-phosphate guanylyltransferase/mannose-6-phosphate isomerase
MRVIGYDWLLPADLDPMAAPRIACFVLSGGIGSRLWPLSREDNPKQFHDLAGQGSMLGRTLRRLKTRNDGETPLYVIASERHADRVQADLAPLDLAGGGPIFEPVGRNTAAAVAVATLETLATFGDELVLIVPSDHEISTDEQFWQSVAAGVEAAQAGRIVTFGIRPTHAETGYGYIETLPSEGAVFDVTRFVEKPDADSADAYVGYGNFFWNAGIFLFRASVIKAAFEEFQPEIWRAAEAAYKAANADVTGKYLPVDLYAQAPAISIDYGIMERAAGIAMVPASFQWSDLGSWQSLLQVSPTDANGNVILGDVVAVDCKNSYIRGEGRLLSVIGLKDVAVVSTPDAVFVAPVERSQHVRMIVEQLERSGRLETKFTPAHDRVLQAGAWRTRVRHWLFEETLPLWSSRGVDERHGGFHEALDFAGEPVARQKRMRTMARQVYAFAAAKRRGWDGPADELIAHGLAFMDGKGRTADGGWVRTLHADGAVADATEDTYDHSCVLLALAHAHACGNPDAERLARETIAFIDTHLTDPQSGGFYETSEGPGERRSNPHMHMLEALLAWHQVTGDADFIRRAGEITRLFRSHFFDADSWTLGEFFDERWRPAADERGAWTEPGHHFEWASLLVDFAERTGQRGLTGYARKLYASAIANGLNRATGLAYGAVSRSAIPFDRISRSWPQAEAVKAAIALDRVRGPDLKPEIEQRVGRLFRWHIDAAPTGMWIDQIDERGRSRATDVPASIFYHLVTALTQYLDATEYVTKSRG